MKAFLQQQTRATTFLSNPTFLFLFSDEDCYNNIFIPHFSVLVSSDEDDTLYEKLSGEQWRLECLMQLLAELKESDLPGDFFLDLLQVRSTYKLMLLSHTHTHWNPEFLDYFPK